MNLSKGVPIKFAKHLCTGFLSVCLVSMLGASFVLADDLRLIPKDPDPGIPSLVSGVGTVEGGQPALLTRVSDYVGNLGVDSRGRVYFTGGPFTVSRTEPDGTITHFIGSSYWDYPDNGPLHETDANLNHFSVSGDFFYYEDYNSIVRINLSTNVSELYATLDDALEPAPNWDVWAIRANTAGDVFVHANNRIYRIDKETRATSHIGGNGQDYPGEDGILAVQSGGFNSSVEMAVDPVSGNPVIADRPDNSLYEIELSTGLFRYLAREMLIEPVAGFPAVVPVYINSEGVIFLSNHDKIYRFSRNDGQFVHVAGNGQSAFNGDGKNWLDSWFRSFVLTGDSLGNLYIHSRGGGTVPRIRKLDNDRGIVTTIVGAPGFLGCASPLDTPFYTEEIGVADNGVIYVKSDAAILAVDELLGTVYPVVGVYAAPGDSVPEELELGQPISLDQSYNGGGFAVAPNGDVYFTDEPAFAGDTRQIYRINATRSRVDTIASGNFKLLHFRGSNLLYAVREIGSRETGGYVDFVRINTTTGAVTTILAGGEDIPVVGESAEGRVFWNYLGSLWDFLVDEEENIYLSITYAYNPDLVPGAYKIDSQTKELSALVTGQAGVGWIHGKLALDEQRNILYLTNQEYVAQGVLKVDLASGAVTRYYGAGENDWEANPYYLSMASSGELYALVSSNDASIMRISDSVTGADRASDEIGENSNLGQAVTSDSGWFAVGAPNSADADNGTGEVFLYRDNDCRPILQQRLAAPAGTSAEKFGSSIAFSNDKLIIAASSSDPIVKRSSLQSETVFSLGVFGYKQGRRTWELTDDLSDDLPPEVEDMSVLTGEGTLSVGTPGADGGSGLVTVFDANNFDQPVQIKPVETDVFGFGKSLASEGSYLAIGANSAANGAVAEVYELQNDQVTRVDRLNSPDTTAQFATAMAMNDTALYIGAPGEGGGKVFDFQLGDSLKLANTLTDPVEPGNASFGAALAIEDGVLVIGSPETTAAQNRMQSKSGKENTGSGSVHVFGVKDGRGNWRSPNGIFSLIAGNTEAYGASVDVDNGRIVIGAPETDNGRGAFEAAGEIVEPAELSGLWYDPRFNGEGFNVLVTGNGIVIYYYGYTREGERLWLFSRTIEGAVKFGETINVPMLKAINGVWTQPGASQEVLMEWGLLSVTFGSLNSATFSLNGWDGSKVTKGQMLLNATREGGPFSGLWYDPSDDGEGYNVISGDIATVIFYYGNTNDGKRLWLMSGNYVENIESGTEYHVDVYEITDGDFYRPTVNTKVWGSMSVRFDNCEEGRIVLEGKDGNKTSDIIKLANVFDSGCQ